MMRNSTIADRIDKELLAAMSASPWSQIPYDQLLQSNPTKIREEEQKLSNREEPFDIPHDLIVQNINIPSFESSRAIRLRTYRPKDKTGLPVLFYFHGGAFIFGTPEQYDFIFYKLALDINAVVVSVDYRLAPEHPFPAAMNDGYDSLLWLSENADCLGGNKKCILIGGSSAGATIAMSITHLARDLSGPKIAHQYLLYPPTDNCMDSVSMKELANMPMQTRNSAIFMWKHYLSGQLNELPKYAVPILQENFEGLPDATIIVCELDPLKDEGKEYAAKLQEAGVKVNLLEIKGAVHTFDFFSCKLSDDFYKQQVGLFKTILIYKK